MADASLQGEVAVVTGARGNLGPLWISTLLDAGAAVLAVDLADATGAVEPGPGHDLTFDIADVTDRTALEAVRERLLARHPGGATILVNNAGIDQPPGPAATHLIEDVPAEDFLRTLQVNLAGTFIATQCFGRDMAAAGLGSIVNIGSLYAGIAPDPGFYDHMGHDPPFLKPPAYGASKAGVVNLTRYFARLWGPHGVRVNTLSPGGVRGGQDPEFTAKFTARVPLRRMAELADLAGPLRFLCSQESAYLTGHELRVDGGFTA